MSKVEKAMNRGELKSYKNFETVVNSMLPGLQSSSPQRYKQRSNQTTPRRFGTRHLMAPPNVNDNSLNRTSKVNDGAQVRPPFQRGSNLFHLTFLVDKMKHDHSLDNLKLDQIRDNILSQFRAKSIVGQQPPSGSMTKSPTQLPTDLRHTLSVFNRKSANAIKPVMDWSYIPGQIVEESARDLKPAYKSQQLPIELETREPKQPRGSPKAQMLPCMINQDSAQDLNAIKQMEQKKSLQAIRQVEPRHLPKVK